MSIRKKDYLVYALILSVMLYVFVDLYEVGEVNDLDLIKPSESTGSVRRVRE